MTYSLQAGVRSLCSAWRQRLTFFRLRRKYWQATAGSEIRFRHFRVRITDGPNFYMQLKDEFYHRIYHFECDRPDPLIIDGGSNMGLSILYFKSIFPKARILGFEPDPNIYRLCQENLRLNGIGDVNLLDAGLAATAGSCGFDPDDTAGGQVSEAGKIQVRVRPLSEYLTQPVDFLKLNIEGQEWPVLQEAAASGRLGQVRQMVVEYHGWPRGPQRLGPILNLLDEQGFRYLVHDFDAESCDTTKPPFRLTPETRWFCLIYARRF